MNGYVYYFTVIIFVMINCSLCSVDNIAEKNYRSIQRRRLVSKLHNRNRKKFKAGWKHTLEEAHIVSDLNTVEIVTVNEIGGDEICEINDIDLSKIYNDMTGDTTGGGQPILRDGCCCNPAESESTTCLAPGLGVYYGSAFWSMPTTNYYLTSDNTGKKYGKACESASITYDSNNYYEIEIYIRSNMPSNKEGGTIASAVTGSSISGVLNHDANKINYLVITKKLKKHVVSTSSSVLSSDLEDYASGLSIDDGNYGSCCTIDSAGKFPFISAATENYNVHKEEIELKLNTGISESAADKTDNYYTIKLSADKLNIKTGDRIILKSGYGQATDYEFQDESGNPQTTAPDNFKTVYSWAGQDINGFGVGGFQSRIGIPYSIGYETITSDENGEEVRTWNDLEAQDWNGNYVSLASVGCRSWWSFINVEPMNSNFEDVTAQAEYKRVLLSDQYQQICMPTERQWMNMLGPGKIEDLKIRINIPSADELKTFHRKIFGYDGESTPANAIQPTTSFTTSDLEEYSVLIARNLFLLQDLGIISLRTSASDPATELNYYTWYNDGAPGPHRQFSDSIYANSVFPTRLYIDFLPISVSMNEYSAFDILLDYPTPAGEESERRYFLVDVEMLGWRDSEGSVTTCNAQPHECVAAGKNLEVLSSEMIETACSPNFYKDYSNNKGRCKKCITSCAYGEYVDTETCTGYGRDTAQVCKSVFKTRFCPGIQGNTGSGFNAIKQIPDCNGVCNGEETDCPWMYGYAQLKNPWSFSFLPPDSEEASTTDCGYYCGKWRGISRMDNGFPDFIFVPIHPDEPICRLLKGHSLVSQCTEDGSDNRDFKCTGGGSNDGSAALYLDGVEFEGEVIQGTESAAYQKAVALINNLPKSESCGGNDVTSEYGYDNLRSADAKSRTFSRTVGSAFQNKLDEERVKRSRL